jgi:septum formation protein
LTQVGAFSDPPANTCEDGAMGTLPLILASGSPRRSELLHRLQLTFEVRPPDVDESREPNEHPLRYVERVARSKARVGWESGEVTLAADTAVFVDGLVLGKPTSTDEAVAMIGRLSGTTHKVYTGVAICHNSKVYSTVERTLVTFVELAPAEIQAYVATGDPMDKAGAYSIQGPSSVFISRVEGDPFSVMGLPLAATRRLFSQADLDLWDHRA